MFRMLHSLDWISSQRSCDLNSAKARLLGLISKSTRLSECLSLKETSESKAARVQRVPSLLIPDHREHRGRIRGPTDNRQRLAVCRHFQLFTFL